MTDHIVIVGGGTGGTVLANDLAERLDADAEDVQITLFNDDPDHVYKPVWLYVPFGQREPADGRRPLPELVDDAVDVRIDRITEIDTEAQQLRSRDGRRPIEYDHLVLATGSNLAPDEIPGLTAAGHQRQFTMGRHCVSSRRAWTAHRSSSSTTRIRRPRSRRLRHCTGRNWRTTSPTGSLHGGYSNDVRTVTYRTHRA